MIKQVFAVYDVQADYYDSPMVFDNERFALAAIRRNCRNMFLKKDVTYDELRDRQFVALGTYNTQSGEFKNNNHDDDSYLKVNLSSFVGDLIGDMDDEV